MAQEQSARRRSERTRSAQDAEGGRAEGPDRRDERGHAHVHGDRDQAERRRADHDHADHEHGDHEHADHHHADHGHADHVHCRHAVERAGQADASLARAEEICAARDQRLTPIRRAVLEALYRTHAPLGAYEIIAHLGEGGGKTHAPITIYRALDFLMEQGFVHRLASRNAFVACPHGHAPDELVAFLICESCGGVDERHSQALTRAVSGMLVAENFKARQQVLEIAGLCAHCRETA